MCHTLLPGFDGHVPRPKKTHDKAIHQKGHSGAGGKLLLLLAVLWEEVVASQTHWHYEVLDNLSVKGYRDGGLLLSMWLCLSLTKGIQKKSLMTFMNSKGRLALKKVLSDHVKKFGFAPHPEVALKSLATSHWVVFVFIRALTGTKLKTDMVSGKGPGRGYAAFQIMTHGPGDRAARLCVVLIDAPVDMMAICFQNIYIYIYGILLAWAVDAIADAVHMCCCWMIAVHTCCCNWISQASHSGLVVMVHGKQETTLAVVVLACVERTCLHWFPMRHHICRHFLGKTDAQAIKW